MDCTIVLFLKVGVKQDDDDDDDFCPTRRSGCGHQFLNRATRSTNKTDENTHKAFFTRTQ